MLLSPLGYASSSSSANPGKPNGFTTEDTEKREGRNGRRRIANVEATSVSEVFKAAQHLVRPGTSAFLRVKSVRRERDLPKLVDRVFFCSLSVGV